MNDSNLLEDQPIAWTPTPEVIERAQLTRFMKEVGASTWEQLYEFSIRDVEKFTEEVLKFLDIKFDPPYEKLLDITNGIEFPEWFSTQRRGDAAVSQAETRPVGSVSSLQKPARSKGETHAGLNITEMCLDRWQTDEMKDQPAVIWEGETGDDRAVSYDELLEMVDRCAAGLKTCGLGKGDAIGIHMPMVVETVVALLAINRIGSVAVPVFSGYGVEAIVSRMNAVGAKALFTSLGFQRRGKQVKSAGLEAAGKCPTVETVFLIRPKQERNEPFRQKAAEYNALSEEERAEYHRNQETETKRRQNDFFDELKQSKVSEEKIAEIRQQMERQPSGSGAVGFGFYDIQRTAIEHPSEIVWWESLMSSEAFADVEPTSAEDPLIILYTSGTTGKPKGIMHTHASFPIKAAQDMAFGTDVGKGTRICWYTDIGWMMGPWLIYGALINGATICIYDGAPDYPTPDRMWEFCAKHKVEILGISPTLIRALSNCGDELPKKHDLSSLRMFASTGEPWNPAPWWWLFEKVGNSKLPIINYSGGTEIAGGILMGNPLLPQKPCSFPAPCLGMDVDIFNENGEPVEPGEVGELVIKQPWIGMARGFWQEKERYLETYWSRFKNIWVHGDWAMRDNDGHWFILGRSDDTLKVAGKRVGPAEVESLLVAHPLVTEAAVIGVPDEMKGTAMVAFCVLFFDTVNSVSSVVKKPGAAETTENTENTEQDEKNGLQHELKILVARDMGKPLTPSKIYFVSALPKTRNAKVMRRVIRSAYLGQDPGDLSALENPKVVAEIAACAEAARK